MSIDLSPGKAIAHREAMFAFSQSDWDVWPAFCHSGHFCCWSLCPSGVCLCALFELPFSTNCHRSFVGTCQQKQTDRHFYLHFLWGKEQPLQAIRVTVKRIISNRRSLLGNSFSWSPLFLPQFFAQTIKHRFASVSLAKLCRDSKATKYYFLFSSSFIWLVVDLIKFAHVDIDTAEHF